MAWPLKLIDGFFKRREIALSHDQRGALDLWLRLPAADVQGLHERMRYVVVDVETSGLNMKRDRLISIGAIAVINSQIDFNDAFQIVLRQEQASTRENILIHGIGGGAQTGGVEPVEALLSFLNYIGNSPLIAYHAVFDQHMIDKAMKTYLGSSLGRTWIDLAWVLPEFFPYITGAKVPLDEWLHYFGIENIVRHNAVSDAYATAKLLQVAIAAGRQKGVENAAGFMRIEKTRRWMCEGS